MAEPAAAPASSGLRVLTDRNFWPYFAGNLLSNCGTWFQNLAQALFIYRLTGSTLLVGVVQFALTGDAEGQVPVPPVGAVGQTVHVHLVGGRMLGWPPG